MSDYNVNLPKTNFPMRADLAKREPNILKFWQDINLYLKNIAAKLNEQPDIKKFILHDGPPYANGEIHLGHAVNKILKDIVMKSKMLEGYITPYVPGWDCHGLPIELNVEKKIGHVGAKVSIDQFITACRQYAENQIDSQRKDFIRLGVLGDWDKPYKTMNFKHEANIIRALAKIIGHGYVERGYKPVHWCTACRSALAEAEVEYKDKTSPAIDVRFQIIDTGRFNCKGSISIPIWTTTPWTLPANEAVALHPDLKYVLVFCPKFNEYFIILEDLLTSVMKRYQEDNYKIVATYTGKDLKGLALKHPFLKDKTVPVILGEHVTVDTGTGAVHTAPAHGQEDFVIGKQYNLPIKNPVGPNGKFLPDTPIFAGEEVFAANDHVIAVLRENNNLLCLETIQHSYPHCWRHKTPLIFRATQQWFISMDKKDATGKSLREKSLAAIETISWFPKDRGKDRIKEMIAQRPDWCISRQRVWGTPMTLFTHNATGELHPEIQHLMEIIAQNIEKEGIIYWHKLDAMQFLQQHAPNYSPADYEKINDTLDVWFDSGVTHYCVLEQNSEKDQTNQYLSYPADLYLEGNDQYRGWFQSSLLTAVALTGEAPYKHNVAHGFTVDAAGHKMSKSVGNVISPQKIVSTLGADVLRLWVAATYMYDDFTISDEILQRKVDAYRMLRNTARFLLGNLFDFNPDKDLVGPQKMLLLDRWAVAQVLELQDKFIKQYNNYEFHVACSDLEVFVASDISSFYFSIIKDRLYTMKADSLGRRSAQTALFHILEILIRCIAPILSFTAEEIWQEMRNSALSYKRTESIFMSKWYDEIKATDFSLDKDKITSDEWHNIQTIRSEVYKELEKLRAAGTIGSGLEADVTIYCEDAIYNVLQKLTPEDGENELRFVLITSSAEVIKTKPEEHPVDAVKLGIPGVSVKVKPTAHQKCCRCWHHRTDVGVHTEHQELCGRCIDNLFGQGETRTYA